METKVGEERKADGGNNGLSFFRSLIQYKGDCLINPLYTPYSFPAIEIPCFHIQNTF